MAQISVKRLDTFHEVIKIADWVAILSGTK
jgi:hypothetical protein